MKWVPKELPKLLKLKILKFSSVEAFAIIHILGSIVKISKDTSFSV
jgi:hypothetical protein